MSLVIFMIVLILYAFLHHLPELKCDYMAIQS